MINCQDSVRKINLNHFLFKKVGDLLRESCLIRFSTVEFEDGHGESTVECELRGEDLQGSSYKSVMIDGMTTEWAKANGIESGVTTVFANNALIDEAKNKLEIPANGVIEVCKNEYD
jgi:hypothetical protein